VTPQCTVVIPAYNESSHLPQVLSQIKALNLPVEILVVDDGSTDNTSQIAQTQKVKLIRHPFRKGYGAALKTGIRNVSTEYTLFLDADGEHPPEYIKNFLEELRAEPEMVVGKRQFRLYPRSLGRIFLGKIADYLVGQKIPDLNSGFRLVKTTLLKKFLPLLPDTFSFTTTLTLSFLKTGYEIKYIPIQILPRCDRSKLNPISDGVRTAVLIIRTITFFEPLKVFCPISAFLFVIGLSHFLYGVIRYFRVSETSVLFILSSILIFLFGLLADQISLLRRE
jgi:glycosyltransferase involved in cell wall biosynthesis